MPTRPAPALLEPAPLSNPLFSSRRHPLRHLLLACSPQCARSWNAAINIPSCAVGSQRASSCSETLDRTRRRGLAVRSVQKMADEEEENNDEEQDEKEIIERQIKTHKALQHMERELQLSTAVVMPVLLKLMKAYDGKWEFIEADNYHVLVDTIFASQESDDVEKGPGPSSAIGKKKRGKKPSTRGTPTRRAPRNSKRTESDDSDEPDCSQELVRRIRGRAPAPVARTPTTTLARPIASCEPATPRASFACGDDDDGPAWEPLLALPAPLQTAPPQVQLELLPSAGGGRELQRISTGLPVRAELVTTMTELVSTMTAVSRETQTEASIFHPEEQAIQPTALICYDESVSEKLTTPVENKALVVKQEQEPLFLSDLEVRRQLLNHGALTSQICKQCDKPRAVRFDPSKVKVEAVQAPGSTKDREPPSMLCLNPAPLQALVPLPLPLPLPSPLPLPLPLPLPANNSVSEDDMDCHVTDPEPLLLTFPTKTASVKTETVAVGTSFAATEGLATHNTTSIRAQQMLRLVPCSKPPAMDTDCPSTAFQPVVKSTVEPASNVATTVENPVDIPSKVEVKEVLKTPPVVEEQEQKLPDGAGCEALRVVCDSEGALAALASYSSDSDTSDTELDPALFSSSDHAGEVMHTSPCCPNADINHDKTNASQGILPLAIASQSNDATFLKPAHEVQTALKLAHEAQTASPKRQHEEETSEVAKNSKDPEMVAASSETSKKRKRSVLELIELEEEQPRTDNNSGAERPSRHDHRDISRGKEKVAISLSRDGTTDVPPEFLYINANVVYQNAHLGISMARIGEDDRCSGCAADCLDNKVPCECTRLTDGEYAHSVEGCLYPHFLKQELERKRNLNLLSYCQPGACPVERTNDEVCKGHVQRRFIKECWEKCGCSQLCGNRVVQRGIVHRLQVFWTESGKGWGIRTLEPLRAGTFVCEYIGEILTNAEMWQRNNVHGKVKHHFSLQLDADWCSERYLKDEEALCLDGRRFGNVARFINHRCIDSNLIDIPVEIESPDHHYYHLAFFTSKDVNENEELTWDYGLDFNDKDHQVEAFECVCGSTFCRGKMEGRAAWV